ncbi:unnamed protein product [Amoebophrya sp. A120]|nr:unnamed protein product [Amoebophrya sp. A120]|eukprot:GSA120T00025504001.1
MLLRWVGVSSRSACHARPQTTSNIVYRWRRWQEGDPVPFSYWENEYYSCF